MTSANLHLNLGASFHMHRTLVFASALLFLFACDQGAATKAEDGAKPADAKSAKAGDDKAKAGDDKGEDTKPAADKAPDCDTVVNNIASFNEGSGDAEKKIWNKMCAEMSDAEKTCVAAAKDMDGMKACIKKDKKLK